LEWNNVQGGINLSFRVIGGPLKQDTTINVYWANGTGIQNRIGAPVFTHIVLTGTTEGQHGPVHIAGDLLSNDPLDVTHLIVVSGETHVGSLDDVRVNFGPNANAAVVWATTLDIIRDGLRAAGQSIATITSTARNVTNQARVMFQNLINPSRSINSNVTAQLRRYGQNGDAVINVFVREIQNMTDQQIRQSEATIRVAMEQEINRLGCYEVTHHCADPTQLNVVDVGASVFNENNGPLFINAVQGRVSHFEDERNDNNAFHLEVR
jgi:hypothetical protein